MGAVVIDDEAFATFVRDHGRSLFGTAYLLTGDGGQAEELVQDVLARLYPQWQRVMAADAPVAYVRRALTNRFVSNRRRPASREVLLADLPETAIASDVAEVVVQRGTLAPLLLALPERQRAALVLRYFHDLGDVEIAEALGCRSGTVRSLLSRGLEALRSRASDTDRALKGGE